MALFFITAGSQFAGGPTWMARHTAMPACLSILLLRHSGSFISIPTLTTRLRLFFWIPVVEFAIQISVEYLTTRYDILLVADLEVQVEWYSATLGFRVNSRCKVPNQGIKFALRRQGAALIELLQLPDAQLFNMPSSGIGPKNSSESEIK
jgi:hypothetical protein